MAHISPKMWRHTGRLYWVLSSDRMIENQQFPVNQTTSSLHIMRSPGVEWAHHAHDLTRHLLEPPLAVLTLVSDPSAVTDARPIDALPGQAVVAQFGRRGVSGQHQVKQHTHHQVSAHAAQVTVGDTFGSQEKRSGVTFDRGIHSYFPGAE